MGGFVSPTEDVNMAQPGPFAFCSLGDTHRLKAREKMDPFRNQAG